MYNSINRLVCAAAIAASVMLAACGGDGQQGARSGMPAVTPPENMADVRNFTTAEMDTLRALKARNNVTRDEYRDDRGGVLGNEWFEVWYPPGKLTVSHGMYVLDHAMQCRKVIAGIFGAAPNEKLTIVCTQTMEAYTEFTGRLWWHYSSIEPNRIIYQPVPILAARGILDIALPREYYEWAIWRIAGNDAPRWLIEGLASRLVNEEAILADNLGEFPEQPVKIPVDAMERALAEDNDKMRARIAYFNAYEMVRTLDREYGREKLAAMISAIGNGSDVETAARSAYGMSYDELLAAAVQWTPPERPKPEGTDEQ